MLYVKGKCAQGKTPSNHRRLPRKSLGKKSKQPWTTGEKEVVLKFFKEQIKQKVLPGKQVIMKCIIENKDVLGHRSWTKIKDFVRNYIRTL